MSCVLRHATSIGPEQILLIFVIRTAGTDVRQDRRCVIDTLAILFILEEKSTNSLILLNSF